MPDEPVFHGKYYTVRFCHGCSKSLEKALGKVPPHRRDKIRLEYEQLIIGWADKGKRISPERFPKEGSLPGKNNGDFYAIKVIPLRAYVWKSNRHNQTYFISHFVNKEFPEA
jgi:hypothetical protein